MTLVQVVSPIDGSVVAERASATAEQLDATLADAHAARAGWRATPVERRIELVEAMVRELEVGADAAALELALQMGRPRAYGANEIRRGFQERARYMNSIAAESLADVEIPAPDGFARRLRREPLGTVLALAPWNYPYLCAVNSVVPALLAGNTVVLKHADQTLLVGERLAAAGTTAGFPAGVFQHVVATHADVAALIADPRVDHVAFTGSVAGGAAIADAAGRRAITSGLELGGKDPAYVRADADLAFAIGETVDGAFFNSGQSCCAVERIYVHRDVYADFVDGFVAATRGYVLGDPRDPATTLGPMVHARAAATVRAQITQALSAGAEELVGEAEFPAARPGTPYVGPTVLVGVDHTMDVMRTESFGPVVGIMPVDSDDAAVDLMNDSDYGLTASIWTSDADAAMAIGDRLDTGTVYLNRCDYVDPALAWTGVKDSGRGHALSRFGFEPVTRLKSFHLRY